MGAGLCPQCRRSVPEAGFLCDRCHEATVAAAPGPLPDRVRLPDPGERPVPPGLRSLLDTCSAQLANATQARPAVCLVEGRQLTFRTWCELVDECPCPLHAKPPTLTVVPKGAA